MIEVIAGNYVVERATGGDSFYCLLETIISQLIAAKVADVLCARLLQLCDGELKAERVQALGLEKIKAIGLTKTKAQCIYDLSEAVVTRNLDLNKLRKKSDPEIIHELTKFKGIGRWSAEMFLLFGLEKPDVFSDLDGGLVRAVSHYYFQDNKPDQAQLQAVSKKWAPYRSYASFYLWKSLERI